jgi:DNA polymerase/3'-5' exonuclease PolX
VTIVDSHYTIRKEVPMFYNTAIQIALKVKAQLAPHCERIEIAGSIRREKAQVKDIEIVAIPKPYDVGLFATGIATVINQWVKVKGELPCKYTQRLLPEGIKLDLFFAEPGNWGLIYAMRTGSAAYSHKVLATGWVKQGFNSKGGYLHHRGKLILTPEEHDLFDRAGVPFVEPQMREI